MGKKKKGAVCNNPIAMARAAGPPPITGPTIKDYLNRDRPSLLVAFSSEEAAGIIASQYNRKESGALAAYEGQLNEDYKKELKRRREKILGGGGVSKSKKSHHHRSRSRERKKKKKKKKTEKRKKYRDRSRSRSKSRSLPSTSTDSDKEQEVLTLLGQTQSSVGGGQVVAMPTGGEPVPSGTTSHQEATSDERSGVMATSDEPSGFMPVEGEINTKDSSHHHLC